jgi:hypothetical protein
MKPPSKKPPSANLPESSQKSQTLRRQLVGIALGAAVGYLLGTIFPDLANWIDLTSLILWFAVLGGVLASLEGFMRAGASITHRENKLVNLLVGLGIPFLLLAVVVLLLRLI